MQHLALIYAHMIHEIQSQRMASPSNIIHINGTITRVGTLSMLFVTNKFEPACDDHNQKSTTTATT